MSRVMWRTLVATEAPDIMVSPLGAGRAATIERTVSLACAVAARPVRAMTGAFVATGWTIGAATGSGAALKGRRQPETIVVVVFTTITISAQ
jgi:hypothetical protein